MKLTSLLSLGITVAVSVCSTASNAEDSYPAHEAFVHSAAYTSTLADVYAKLKPVFEKYYPSATMTNFGAGGAGGLHFEYAVTNFDFSMSVKPGGSAKRESPIQKGPRNGGILCNVSLEKGKHNGQRILVFTPVEGGEFSRLIIDRKEYKEIMLTAYSAKRDASIRVVLAYPSDTSDEFLNEFRETVMSFPSSGFAPPFEGNYYLVGNPECTVVMSNGFYSGATPYNPAGDVDGSGRYRTQPIGTNTWELVMLDRPWIFLVRTERGSVWLKGKGLTNEVELKAR